MSISLFKYVALTCLQTNFHSALIRMSERKGNNCLSSLAWGSSECRGVRGARDENRTCIYLLTPSLHLSLFLLCPCIYLSFLYALYMPFLRLKTPFIVLIRQWGWWLRSNCFIFILFVFYKKFNFSSIFHFGKGKPESRC